VLSQGLHAIEQGNQKRPFLATQPRRLKCVSELGRLVKGDKEREKHVDIKCKLRFLIKKKEIKEFNMDMKFKQEFIELWERYFPSADLPIGFYYTDEEGQGELVQPPKGHQCIICQLAVVRRGKSLCFDENGVGCEGGKRYLGFRQDLMPRFEYFLSCGIPGELEGERYKKSPELVKEQLKHHPPFEAPGKYIAFKRWDKMDEADEPAVVIFFAPADVISGLFTLANFDAPDPHAVITPFGSGCSCIVYYPYHELQSPRPRAMLGMFDVSARPCVPSGVLTFAVPWSKFVRMVDDMEESFLITGTWNKVQARIKQLREEGRERKL